MRKEKLFQLSRQEKNGNIERRLLHCSFSKPREIAQAVPLNRKIGAKSKVCVPCVLVRTLQRGLHVPVAHHRRAILCDLWFLASTMTEIRKGALDFGPQQSVGVLCFPGFESSSRVVEVFQSISLV